MPRTGAVSTARLAVLAILARGNRHAYEIGQAIAEDSEGALRIGDGTLYPLLQAMVATGTLESWQDRSASGRSVRMYALRQRGREELRTLSQDWERETAGVRRLLDRERQT